MLIERSNVGRLLAPNPCIQAIGPIPNKILFIGEAPGEMEQKLGIPFVGKAGQEFDRILAEAKLNTGSVRKTNVFWTRPLNNKLDTIFIPSSEWKMQFPGQTSSVPFKIDNKIHFLPPAFDSELTRLHSEIAECNPNLIVCLGATALWALTGRQNISSMRGTVLESTLLSATRKILPTYHPAAVLRQWDLRPIVIADLLKAKRAMEYPELRRPRRIITINPSLSDLQAFLEKLISGGYSALAVDVETRNGQITEIGFAPNPWEALVVPFIKGYKTDYWPTASEEASALSLVRSILQHPIPKVFQNGLYDLQYIWRNWHFTPRNCLHDTMIRHHSLFPEMQKGLGFLGSIYTEEPAWKFMRHSKETEGKRDDE